MKLAIYVLITFILTGELFSADEPDKINDQPRDSISTITFSVVGDLMCHSTQFKWASVSKDSFDFKPVFREIKPYLESADFTMGNLETVVNPKDSVYDGYPVFNTPIEYLEALEYSGFDLLFTANNHTTDGRKEGIVETINSIKKYNMDYSGTFLNSNDRDSIRIYSMNNITFTVLSYTYGVNINNLTPRDKFMVNFIDTLQMKRDIGACRSKGIELVIVYLHAGSENAHEPTNYQREVVDKLLEYGADIIVSSSPHVLQPINFFQSDNGRIDTVMVAYSLGNFLSNQRWRYSDGGVILSFTVTQNDSTGNLKLGGVEYLPVWLYKGWTGKRNEYMLLPPDAVYDSTTYSYLDEVSLSKMGEFITDTEKVLNGYSSRPKIKEIHEASIVVSDTSKVN